MTKLQRRILVIAPLFITQEEAENIKKFLEGYAWDDTEIDVTGLQENVAVNSISEADMATPEFLRLAIEAEEDGYDALISYCYVDVGVDAARETVKIPVIGPLEASVLVANMLGKKFSAISVGATYPPGEFYILPRLRVLGLERSYVSTRGIPFEKFFVFSKDIRRKETMRNALIKECRKALKDGAHCLVLACTGFPPAGDLGAELNAPIIDASIALKVAEILIDLKIDLSRLQSQPSLIANQRPTGEKMRIKLLVPISASLDANLIEGYNKFVNKGTQISVTQFEKGPESIRFASDIAKVAPFIIREAAKAESEGYDAVVISSFEDPGLESAREVCEIPVIGLGESSLLFACIQGMKISIITSDGRVKPLLEKMVRKMGLEKRLLSIISISKQAEERMPRLDTEKFLFETEKAVDAGAEAIVIGEADAHEMIQSIGRRVAARIIDPMSVALKTAEAFHSMNISHSKLSHPKPVLPKYHKNRLAKLERKPTENLFLYGDQRSSSQSTHNPL